MKIVKSVHRTPLEKGERSKSGTNIVGESVFTVLSTAFHLSLFTFHFFPFLCKEQTISTEQATKDISQLFPWTDTLYLVELFYLSAN
jgi:hypothetical protein